MSEREDLIAAKKQEVQAELDRWARANLHPGEQLVFELSLVRHPLVAEKSDVRQMKVGDYFTRARWLAAGADRKRYIRGLNCIMNASHYAEAFGGNSARTVGDVALLTKDQLLKVSNLGKVIADDIERVLNHDGIYLCE